VLGGWLGRHHQDDPIKVTFGQHVQDVYLTGSSEGAPIRKLWGRMRLGGNVIWCSKFKEWQETDVNWTPSASAGKGGGGGGTKWTPELTIVYHANLSFAVAFCEGGPGTSLGRVWADGKALDLAQYSWRFYNGSAQQLPDTHIESIEGTGNVPAYRGICYLAFESMVLDRFGNRMPQISAEILRMPEIADPDDLTNGLRSVCMIPAMGEFVYGTQVYKASDGAGYTWPQNANIDDSRADFLIALDQLAGANELPAVAPPVPLWNLPWGGNPDPPTGGNWASSRGALSSPNAVSLAVAWFGTDLRAGNCQIVPKVETANKNTTPADWEVAGYTRRGTAWFMMIYGLPVRTGYQPYLYVNENYHGPYELPFGAAAPIVSQIDVSLFDPNGAGGSIAFGGGTAPAYGGTPSDGTVIQAIREIKRRGLRCVFYPFVAMDIPPGNTLPNPYSDNATGIGQAAFPWRGRITCAPAPGYAGTVDKTAAAAAQINTFFDQYGAMVTHYANLCVQAGGVDAFVIGSELTGLTQVRSSPGDGPTPPSSASNRSLPPCAPFSAPERRSAMRRIGASIMHTAPRTGRTTSSSTSTRYGLIPTSISSASIIIYRCRTGAMWVPMPITAPRAPSRPMTRVISRRISRVANISIGITQAMLTAPLRSARRSSTRLTASTGSSAPKTFARGGRTSITIARAASRTRRPRPGARSRSRSGLPNSAAPRSIRAPTSRMSSSIRNPQNRSIPFFRMAPATTRSSAPISGRC
jgi:hypothetical protein